MYNLQDPTCYIDGWDKEGLSLTLSSWLPSHPRRTHRKEKLKSPSADEPSHLSSYPDELSTIPSVRFWSRRMSSPQTSIDLQGSQGLPELPYTLRTRKLSIAIHWSALCIVTSLLPITLYFIVKYAAHAEIDVGKNSAAPSPTCLRTVC
jgi:hypothetical protein